MAKHYIIMSSSYTDGTRVALDITEERRLNDSDIRGIIQQIKSGCGEDVPLSTHFIETESDVWLSVKEYDPFFEGVACVQSVGDFIEKVKGGRVLSGLDVAAYILSKVKCTHLSLEKLAYFAYADYLCAVGKPLFKDRIYAFAHGPVIESVYEQYKQSGYQYVEPPKENDPDLRGGVAEATAKSRILFAADGAEKLFSIDRTIQKYGKYTAGALETRTHRTGSPWSQVDSSKRYQTISDDLIKTYHHIEEAGA